MEAYGNVRSGVTGFDIGDNWIHIRFASGGIYEYTYDIPGADEVETMKELAWAGEGLNSYINRFVGKRYARKIR